MFENVEREMDGQLMTERKMPVIAILFIVERWQLFKLIHETLG